LYVYTPTFTEPDGAISPGKDDGGAIVLAVADVGAGCVTVHYDPDVRFVLWVAVDTTLQAGWAAKTAAEINADYPGILS
jgi:hypothetical protein